MIGVDTNVLVRLFVSDDETQHQLARKFFAARSRSDAAFVSLVVAVEFVWVLTRAFRRKQAEALSLLRIVLTSEDAVVEQDERLLLAVQLALETEADFADILIGGAGELAGCTTTVTFDRDASRRISGMELLA